MKKEDWKDFFLRSVLGFGSLALAIILYFVILRFSVLQGYFMRITRILRPFVYGGILAFLLKTPCNFIEQKIYPRFPEKHKNKVPVIAIAIVMTLTLLACYALVAMVLPQLVSSIRILTRTFPRKLNQFTKWIETALAGNEIASSYINTIANSIGTKLNQWARLELLPSMQGVMNGVTARVTSVLGTLYNVMIGLIVCAYTLGSRRKFVRQGKAVLYAVLPEKAADWILREMKFINKTFVGFFGGKILDSVIVGGICYFFCTVMNLINGFPNAVLISVIVAITNMIPYFGPYIGMVPAGILILMQSTMNCIIFLIFINVLQQIDGNILGPRLLANSVGLSAFWVLFSITLFGGIFGFMGILVGVPTFAVIYDLIRRGVRKSLKKRNKEELMNDVL